MWQWLEDFGREHKTDIIHFLLDVIFFLIIFISQRFSLGKTLTAGDVFDITAVTSVILAFILDFAASGLARIITNHKEDMEKLTTDYKGLVNRYYDDQERMVRTADLNGKEVILPVVVDAWTYGRDFRIEDSRNEYQLPPATAGHFDELFSAHSTSNVYNNTNIRVDDWGIEKNEFVLHTSRTTYFNSLVTNRAMDYKLSNGITMRDLFECGPSIHPLSDSVLSDHLGFNGFVISSDGYIVLVKRSGNVSIGKRTVGDSIGASLKVKYALNHGCFTVEGLVNGIVREIKDELSIDAGDLETLIPERNIIAAYRDLVEGGKPQLFIVIKAKISRERIQNQFDDTVQQSDNSKLERDGNQLIWIPASDLEQIRCSTDHIHYKGTNYPMVPSAIAGFIIYRNYLKEKRL